MFLGHIFTTVLFIFIFLIPGPSAVLTLVLRPLSSLPFERLQSSVDSVSYSIVAIYVYTYINIYGNMYLSLAIRKK